ncbi:MAG: response regulator [Vicinamibacterales bacterium]
MGVVLKVRLPFRLGFATKPAAGTADPRQGQGGGQPTIALPADDTRTGEAGVGPQPPQDRTAIAERTPVAAGHGTAMPATGPDTGVPSPAEVDQASSSLVWLAYTSALASRATTLEDAALAALEGRLDPSPRRRAARETYKLATSLWLVEARDAARMAWEAAGLLESGTLLGTANALRLSQIVEALHGTLRTLPPPDALSPAGRPTSPALLVVDDDDALARELPIEAAVRGWRAKVIRHLTDPLDDQADVIVLGPDGLGDADGAARARLLAAHPNAAIAALVSGPSLLERSAAHPLSAARTLCKPIAPAAIVDEAIDLVRRRQATRPVIVLGLVDPDLRARARTVLADLGAVTEVHENGEAVWDVVTQLRPELCVLDERCAGGPSLHVPRAMRRELDVAAASVILVTPASDEAAAARAAAAGADDWLPSAAVPSLLLPLSRNRLERTRTQREAADLDPATRLPHLRSVIPTFERMVAIARRYDHTLAMLMVEVDGIGPASASRDPEPMQRLSTLLGRRLARAFRAEDVVAHVAPGRFAIAAFGMKSEDGVHRMAELLESFREQAVQGADRTAVAASFSAGIAQIRVDGKDAGELIRAAEAALASARRQGGNRIEAATRGEASRVEWTADALVIDPDAPFAALVEHALETRGHRVRTVGDGREALELLTHPEAPVRARLLVLELGLPGLDGLTLLGQLAEAGVLKTSKAVVVTTRSVEAEMIAAMELGAVDYVTKPVSLPVLMRRLRSALSGSAGVG